MHWRPPFRASYAYLLGLYLGDGCLSWTGRAFTLVISLDARYPGIVESCRRAIESVRPEARIAVTKHRTHECVRVTAGWKYWDSAFPQHGPGRKHERPIVLEPWQANIVRRHPDEFVRGLIHSDGCRTTNRFKTKLPSGRTAEYEYVRYFFSNLSADIRGLFCDACDQLGIRWTQSNHRNISVSHRDSVARLEAIVGPKA